MLTTAWSFGVVWGRRRPVAEVVEGVFDIDLDVVPIAVKVGLPPKGGLEWLLEVSTMTVGEVVMEVDGVDGVDRVWGRCHGGKEIKP